MGFPFGSAVVSVHAHATEDEQRVFDALKKILPSKMEVRRDVMKGHYGNPIVGLEARISQRSAIKELWHRVLASLRKGELEALKYTVHQKVDDSCNLYLRFDKQVALKGELVLAEGGDSIHMRLKVVVFPSKREIAVEGVRSLLEGKDEAET
jgi:RNA binding exosome subunit